MSTPTSVYRYLDADGVLIYVGITNRGVQRQAEHVVHSKWWRFVHSQDVEHYDDRETAERRERYLIEKHQPPFNVVHNADHKRRLAAYLKHADTAAVPCKFDGRVDCDEPDYCPAFYENVNTDWCGVPECAQCHRAWHVACEANGHGVEWDEMTFITDLAIFCGSENLAVSLAAFGLVSALQTLACALEDNSGATLDPDWPDRLRRRMPTSAQIVKYTSPTPIGGDA